MAREAAPPTRERARELLGRLALGVDGRTAEERALRLLELVAGLDADDGGAVRALLLEAGACAAVRGGR